mmetsp:Transcript_18219/g.25914  ORF Transcript_18219/g.25914 Transcript_18219/m.25914 type:complete len:194 (+) Transcript_18219:171-752(+)
MNIKRKRSAVTFGFLLLTQLCCFTHSLEPSYTAGLCSSIPAYFIWQLNFSHPCDAVPPTITYGQGTGIQRYSCNVSPADLSITEMTPVSVHTIQIIELNTFMFPAKAAKLVNLNLKNGGMLNYTSIAVTNPNVKLGGMSMRLIGDNSLGEEVDLTWSVQYNNSSDTSEKVFSLGDSIGWTNFTVLKYLLCTSN